MKLSPKQMSAYIKMDYTWKSAYELGCRLDTLQAVVKKGYAQVQYGLGSSAFPRSCIYFKKSDKPT